MENYYLRTERHREQAEKKADKDKLETIQTTLENISTTEYRSLGPKQLGDHIWRQLKMPQLLSELGFPLHKSFSSTV